MPQILGKDVGSTGFGMMGLTTKQPPVPEAQAFATLQAALGAGSNFWNGGEFYGPPDANSLVLLEKYFAQHPGDADKVVLSIKGAFSHAAMATDGSPEAIRQSIDSCMAQLQGRKKIDIFECARRDPSVPLALTLGTIDSEYVQTGKVGGVGLSEVRAETIHEAVQHTKIAAVEVELSLFSTDALTNGVAAACAQYGIPLVAYSPVGRGFLAGAYTTAEDVPAQLRILPRFQAENFEANRRLAAQVEAMAARKGCTTAQFAIGWVRALARRPGMPVIIPIPGASTAERVQENAREVDIADSEMAEIDAILAKFEVKGARYPDFVPTDT